MHRAPRVVHTLQITYILTVFTCIISHRGGRGGKGAERQVSADGVYTNHRFMQAVGALVGLPVRVSDYILKSYCRKVLGQIRE